MWNIGRIRFLRLSASRVCERLYCLQTQWAWRPYVIVHDNLPRAASFICPCEEIYNLFTLSYWEMCACVPNKLHIWLCVCVCVCVCVWVPFKCGSDTVLWLLSHLLTSFLSPCTSRLSNLLLLISGNWNIFCCCLNCFSASTNMEQMTACDLYMWICLYEAASSAVITKTFFTFFVCQKIVYFILFISHYIIIYIFCRNNITKLK